MVRVTWRHQKSGRWALEKWGEPWGLQTSVICTPIHKLSVFASFCITVFACGHMFIFVPADSYISKSSSLPGYRRNALNRVSVLMCVSLCVCACVWERERGIERVRQDKTRQATVNFSKVLDITWYYSNLTQCGKLFVRTPHWFLISHTLFNSILWLILSPYYDNKMHLFIHVCLCPGSLWALVQIITSMTAVMQLTGRSEVRLVQLESAFFPASFTSPPDAYHLERTQ